MILYRDKKSKQSQNNLFSYPFIMLKKQFHPSAIYLLDRWFKQKFFDGDEINGKSVTYEIVQKGTGYRMYFNPIQEYYTWYFSIPVDKWEHHIHLNISDETAFLWFLQIHNFEINPIG